MSRKRTRQKQTRSRNNLRKSSFRDIILTFETLEERHLLAVTPLVSDNSVLFDGDANDSLYLTTLVSGSDYVLGYNTDGSTTYTPLPSLDITSLDSSKTLDIATDADITTTEAITLSARSSKVKASLVVWSIPRRMPPSRSMVVRSVQPI